MSVTVPSAERKTSAMYSAYAWTAFAACVAVALLAITVLPGLERRRRWASGSARAFFRLAGIGLELEGADRLPEGQAVVVANHASYLDGVILQAVLPTTFAYVIKREMNNVPAAGFLLRRIGSRFVDRNAAGASARDARSLVRAATDGESLGFFPEGTFHRVPGLARFRPGAFVTAIRSRAALVPLVIHGSRHVLPADTFRVARGRLRVEVLPPIHPGEPAFVSAKALSDAARKRILDALNEPDLALPK